MKFNIILKLLTVVVLPIIALLIFSLNHIDKKHSLLESANLQLTHLQIIDKSTKLIYELQIERGVSANYLSLDGGKGFISILKKQILKTDTSVKYFLLLVEALKKETLSKSTKRQFNEIQKNINNINITRSLIQDHKLSEKKSFEFYSTINNLLMSVINGLKLNVSSHQTNTEIITLFKIIELQEYAGQERALTSKLLSVHNISNENMLLYYSLLSAQEKDYVDINTLLRKGTFENDLKMIHSKYKNNFFGYARREFKNHEIKLEIVNEIYKIIGYGGMIHDLVRLKRSGESAYFKDFLNKQIVLDELIQKYLELSLKGSKEYIIAQELQDSFTNLAIDSSKKWFAVSSARIDKMYSLANKLILGIKTSITQEIQTTQDLLKYQIILTLSTIFILLLGTFYMARKIKLSIRKLEDGANEQTTSLERLNLSLEDKVAKDEFLANMSHEIRTPLNAILGFITILQRRIKEEKSLNYLNIIDTSGKSLLTIINDILDFSKIQSGKFSITPYVTRPVEEFSNACSFFASKAYEKHLIYIVYIKFTPEDGEVKVKVLKKYLTDFGAKDILELKEFDDEYNDETANSNKASIAMLCSNSIKLARLKHIQALHAPFTHKAIVQVISATNLKDINLVKFQKPEDQDTRIQYKIANNGLEVVEMFKKKDLYGT